MESSIYDASRILIKTYNTKENPWVQTAFTAFGKMVQLVSGFFKVITKCTNFLKHLQPEAYDSGVIDLERRQRSPISQSAHTLDVCALYHSKQSTVEEICTAFILCSIIERSFS